jgi:hypothetical protein
MTMSPPHVEATAARVTPPDGVPLRMTMADSTTGRIA